MPQQTQQKKIQAGIELQQQGAVQEARALFSEVLSADPDNVACLYSVAAIDSNAQSYTSALPLIEKVTSLAPNFALGHLAYSVILFHLKRLDESKAAVLRALTLEGDLQEAQAHLEVLEGHKSEAKFHVTDPQASALIHQALDLQAQQQHTQAETLLRQALAIDHKNFAALYSLGISVDHLGRTTEALQIYSTACELHPNIALGQFAKASTLQKLGLAEAALEAFDLAIQVDPNYMEAYCNKAALLQGIHRHHEALITLTKATEINPNHVRAYEGQGLILNQFKDYTLSTHAFKRALELNPDYDYGEGNLLGAKLHNCDWSDFEASRERIFQGIREGKRVCNPMTMMAISDDIELTSKCVQIYAQHKYQPSSTPLWNGQVYQHRKKRIAFLSGDFRIHPVGYLLIGLIEAFDKSKFEITGFSSCVSDNSDLWKRYRCAFDHYIDCHGMTSLDAAKLMRAMEIDIAIDLSGHTEGTRLDILSHRPAPVQATYLGFPGTLGLPFIDYLIADPRLIPPELEKHYTEKVLTLPHCYLPRDESVVPSDITPERSDFGLPDEGIVFCSFNHDYKINPPLFKVWMDLLKAVPGSVLWLMKLNQGADKNLKESAKAMGISEDRLVFASRLTRVEDHLARYRLADVFLDAFPYNGHTTAGDALRAGLPVVTLYGESFASRVALSLLHDLNLTEYACNSFEDYFKVALLLAKDFRVRKKYKQHLLNKITEQRWPLSAIKLAEEFTIKIGNLSKTSIRPINYDK